MKDKKIVIKLKHLYENDPVDRLRGRDIYLELKKRGYNVELYNLQKKIDILLNLDDKSTALPLFLRQEVQIKKVIFDIQDDHFTYNQHAMKIINNKIYKPSLLNRIKKLNKEKIKNKLLSRFVHKFNTYLFKEYVRKADFVITSSYSLERIAKNYNKNVRCIPDSVDFSLYPKKSFYNNNEVNVVWMGTIGNIPYLIIVDKVLYELQKKYNIKVKIISSKEIFNNPYSKQFLEKFSFNFEFIEWKKDTFGYELTKADIGIAPLPDKIVKSSNKVLSYMASGLPVVCSSVYDYKILNKKYKDILFIATNQEEWKKSLEKLILNKKLRAEKGEKGRQIAQDFSLENIVNEYEKLFRNLFTYE